MSPPGWPQWKPNCVCPGFNVNWKLWGPIAYWFALSVNQPASIPHRATVTRSGTLLDRTVPLTSLPLTLRALCKFKSVQMIRAYVNPGRKGQVCPWGYHGSRGPPGLLPSGALDPLPPGYRTGVSSLRLKPKNLASPCFLGCTNSVSAFIRNNGHILGRRNSSILWWYLTRAARLWKCVTKWSVVFRRPVRPACPSGMSLRLCVCKGLPCKTVP